MGKKVYRMSLVSSLFLLIIGVLMITNGELFFESISKIIGIIFIVIGIFPVVDYFRHRSATMLTGVGLISGVFSIVFGLLFLLNEDMLSTIIPVFVGVWMIINGINKIGLSYELKDNEESSWIVTFIFSVLIVILGAYMIIDPISGSDIISSAIGIIICVYATFDIIDCILIWIKMRKINKEVENMSKIDKKKVVDEQ